MVAQSHDNLSFETWNFGNIVSTGKNTRCIQVNDGVSFPSEPPKIQLCTDSDPPLEVVEVSLDGGSRSLIVKVSQDSPLLQSLSALDRFAVTTAEFKSNELFKKQFHSDQLLQIYHPLLNDGLLNLTINDNVQVWKLLEEASDDSQEKKFCDASLESLVSGDKVWLCVEVKALYFLPRSFGIALAASDVLVIPTTKVKVFPFASRTRRFSYIPAAGALACSPCLEEEEKEVQG